MERHSGIFINLRDTWNSHHWILFDFLKALVPDLTQETGTHHPALPAHRTAAVFACTECAFHVQQICDLVPLGSPHISVWTRCHIRLWSLPTLNLHQRCCKGAILVCVQCISHWLCQQWSIWNIYLALLRKKNKISVESSVHVITDDGCLQLVAV